MEKAIMFWDGLEKIGREKNQLAAVVRELCCVDLFYLLVRACKRVDMLHPWVYERVREVESDPDGHLDLWSREHFKSSTITFGKTIQDILKDPEITFGIFSHTRPIAKAFLRQIMVELASNQTLHAAFPDVLWGTDVRQSPKWSEDEGIVVKRKSNPKEATIEAWGLVDGQPTSKHFKVLLYDDIVVQASVTTPEMIEKTMTALEQSYNLGTTPGIRRFAGTRWHFNDAYSTLIKRGSAKLRMYPATKDGTEDGEPVFWTREQLNQKRRDMGPYTFAAQMLLNPKADSLQGFKRDWLKHYKIMTPMMMRRMNLYILVDAANAKRKESDYTAIWVVGLNTDKNFYALDITRDRLNLSERTKCVMDLHRKYSGMGCNVVQVRYERYGLMADIDHIKTVQENENYRFFITEVAGRTPKDDRIRRLIPIFEKGTIYLPETHYKTDYERVPRDLVHDFIEEEYMAFPVSAHKDMMDSLSRIAEPDVPLVWPQINSVSLSEDSFMPTKAAYAT
jgi:predicted phage terminase large subunit-like protein